MSAQVIAFPRKKPLAWDELPGYWSYAHKSYYEMDIEDGLDHEAAFLKHDLIARAPTPIAGLKFKAESREQYIARLQAIALSPEDALKRRGTA